MNIEQEYGRIVDEFDVFACYPKLKKRKAAEDLIVDWFRSHMNCHGILCIGTNQTDIKNVRHFAEQENVCCQYVLCKDSDFEQLEKISWEKIDCILTISLHGEAQISHYLCERRMTFESLYDYFCMNGLYLEDEYYRLNIEDMPGSLEKIVMEVFPGQEGWRNNIIAELLCQKEKYINENDCQRKKLFLERQLVLAIYMKNFVLAGQIIQESEKQQIKLEENYLRAWDQICRLLDRIRAELKNRQKEDIVVNWIDGLGYGDGTDMSYLQSQINNGVGFTNAFTVTPYTKPTWRTIFNEKKDVDDLGYKSIRINRESKLVAYLQKKGYQIKIISGYMTDCDAEIRSNTCHGLYSPCSEILWDMWRNLLIESDKMVVFCHLLAETHYPNLSTKMELGRLNDSYGKGRQEVDEQMQFYMSGLNDSATKIYMSDHGHLQDFQVYCVVNSGNLNPMKVNGMFSLIDFHKLLEQIIEKKNICEDQLTREYVEVQNLDHYNPKAIKDTVIHKKRLERQLFGYRGIIDQKYVYVHYNIGKEWLAKRDGMVYEPHLQSEADDVCDKSLLPYYRSLVGQNPAGFYDDPKFRYCKYIYELYNNFTKQKNPCFALLNQIFEPYEDHSVAIRLGGPSSAEVYFWLTEQNRKKIYGFIDNYSKCVCSKIKETKIMSSKDAFKHPEIKAVLLASYKNMAMLRKEAEQYPAGIDILNLYDYFEKHDCKMEHNFSDPYMDDDGYEVDFPMNDVGI